MERFKPLTPSIFYLNYYLLLEGDRHYMKSVIHTHIRGLRVRVVENLNKKEFRYVCRIFLSRTCRKTTLPLRQFITATRLPNFLQVMNTFPNSHKKNILSIINTMDLNRINSSPFRNKRNIYMSKCTNMIFLTIQILLSTTIRGGSNKVHYPNLPFVFVIKIPKLRISSEANIAFFLPLATLLLTFYHYAGYFQCILPTQ